MAMSAAAVCAFRRSITCANNPSAARVVPVPSNASIRQSRSVNAQGSGNSAMCRMRSIMHSMMCSVEAFCWFANVCKRCQLIAASELMALINALTALWSIR